MSFSAEWDECYRKGGQAIRWPWSDVVSYTMRYARATGPDYRVLELGCGSGANIPFFKSPPCQYYAVDGSDVVLEQVKEQHPDLSERLAQADFTDELPFPGEFDLVIDRGSLTCNHSSAIRRGLRLVHQKLKKGGKYVGIDWFSTQHPDFRRGKPTDDAHTRTGFEDGLFAHLGRIHFADQAHLLDLFSAFRVIVLEHKMIQRQIPDDGWQVATWNLVAEKA